MLCGIPDRLPVEHRGVNVIELNHVMSVEDQGGRIVTRVLVDNTYTQAVVTIGSAAGASSTTNTFTADRLKLGDKLAFTSSPATGATIVIEYEVQKH